MKALLSLLAAVSVLSLAVPANAAVQPFPNERRIVNYLTNGTPVYAVYQIVGYDAMGYPIYQWVTQPISPVYVRPCRSYNYGFHGYNSRPFYVRPTYVHPYYGGHAGHVGSFSHGGGHHR